MIDIAVIVEPRLHIYLKPVIDNILRNINNNTPIHIFHSKINEEFIRNNYSVLIENHKIILSYIILNQKIMNNLQLSEYNLLLTSVDFWNTINGENILIFQTDSCMCRHINTFNFTEYTQCGFIGAPFRIYPKNGLNGGFSIRKKSLMIKAINYYRNIKISTNEDKFFTIMCNKITNPASYNLAKEFSVEQFYYDNPLGIHKPWIYLSKENWMELKNKFPEISLTFNNL
jgi:hypothetical protein